MEQILVQMLSNKLGMSYHESLAVIRKTLKVNPESSIELAKYSGVIALGNKKQLRKLFLGEA